MRNWDAHYTDPENSTSPPDALLIQVAEMLPPGIALDLACGSGRHALYLASLGWRVDAVDRSRVAIELLERRSRGLAIQSRVADIEAGEFSIEPDAYDLVCDFFYLQRELFPAIRAGVKPGGVFTGAIHLAESAPGDSHDPAFTLQSGELRQLFAGWKIVFYSESLRGTDRRRAARIIVRRA